MSQPRPVVGAGDAETEARLRFETFLANLSSHLLKLPASALPHEIDCALAGLVDALEVDRASIAVFTPDRQSLLLEHTFARPGTVALAKGFDYCTSLPWYAEQIRRGRRMSFESLEEELPPDAVAEREFVAASGQQSHVVLALVVGEEILGALGVATFTHRRRFSGGFLTRMELLASVFAHAVYRSRAEGRITAAEELNRAVLCAMPSELVLLDGEGRLVSLNDAARRCLAQGDDVTTGMDYLALLAAATAGGVGSTAVIDGIRAVVTRRDGSFEGTYGHPGPGGTRHHLAHAVALDETGRTLVVNTDVTELEQTKARLERSLSELQELKERIEAENVILHQEVRHVHGFETIVGRSAALGRVLSQIEQVAPTDSPVLLLGETGTGKDLVARALHDRSRRRERPIVAVNCAALPPTLIESELFGYERGAFTGALQRSFGRFEIADKGTILLDEIGELPLEVQAKLLRVLQTGEFERLGSPRTIRTNVRIIAATNRDLEREMREGRFRADLFYRLSVFPVVLPPLRDRPEDVPLLVWHFVSRKQAQLGRSIKRIPDRLMRSLTTYSWPGNVRELENVIERALILSEGNTLTADPLLFAGTREGAPMGGTGTLEDMERAYIRAVLVECNWKVAGPGNAADRLGLNRSTLQFRMKKLGIERPARDGG